MAFCVKGCIRLAKAAVDVVAGTHVLDPRSVVTSGRPDVLCSVCSPARRRSKGACAAMCVIFCVVSRLIVFSLHK